MAAIAVRGKISDAPAASAGPQDNCCGDKCLDLCMMTTRAPERLLVSRPRSNNRQVNYDGDSFFYSYADTRKIRDIKADPTVTLDYQGEGVWLSLNGRAKLHTGNAMLEKHWTPDLDAWFEDGSRLLA